MRPFLILPIKLLMEPVGVRPQRGPIQAQATILKMEQAHPVQAIQIIQQALQEQPRSPPTQQTRLLQTILQIRLTQAILQTLQLIQQTQQIHLTPPTTVDQPTKLAQQIQQAQMVGLLPRLMEPLQDKLEEPALWLITEQQVAILA